MNRWKGTITLVIAIIFVFLSMSVGVYAASGKYSLPTSAKFYCYDYDKGRWEYVKKLTFKYNKKGDPVRYDTMYSTSKISYKYTKKNKRKQMIVNDENPDDQSGARVKYYYKKGRLYQTSMGVDKSPVKINKKGWVKEYTDWEVHTISFKYYKNGSPKKMKNSDGYYTKFYKNGLPKETTFGWFEDGSSKWSYKIKGKGKVTKLIYKAKWGGNEKIKVVFSYSKKIKTDDQRKWAVIISNSIGSFFKLGPYYYASLPYAVQNDFYD